MYLTEWILCQAVSTMYLWIPEDFQNIFISHYFISFSHLSIAVGKAGFVICFIEEKTWHWKVKWFAQGYIVLSGRAKQEPTFSIIPYYSH